jgi:hypothetical protein
MLPVREIPFDDLYAADLVVDAVYKGGSAANIGADPLQRLLPVGNSGGFRYKGRGSGSGISNCLLIALYSTEDEPNWPDHLDVETGRFTYYGDNRRPGHLLHDTPRGGNRLLQQMFDVLHTGDRARIPPLFIFTTTGVGRDIRFRGLAAPGAPSLQAADDLVAVWKTTGGSRFQNYRAAFSVLGVEHVSRRWIDDILIGQPLSANAPVAWNKFVVNGTYHVLAAPRGLAHRKPAQQKPATPEGIQ